MTRAASRFMARAADSLMQVNRDDRSRPHGRALGESCAFFALLCLLVSPAAAAVFQSGPGRFEIVASKAEQARALTAAAEEAWRALAAPLLLPDSFSSPVFFRVVDAAEWSETGPFRTTVEAGGVVSVRIRSGLDARDRTVRRAVVQGLLMRLAVAQQGVHERLTAPLWLEQGAVTWWETRTNAAQLDAVKQKSERLNPPSLEGLLAWQRSEVETQDHFLGAFWLMSFLQVESGRAAEWPAALRLLLAGEAPSAAIARAFPGRFANDVERELWWQTGWHHVRRSRTLPGLSGADSHRALEWHARFVVEVDGRDVVAPLRVILAHAREPFVVAELQRRDVELSRLAPALHPFYRNAGLSLADAIAAREGPPAKRDAVCLAFERDWRDATELVAITAAALDRLERR